MGERMNVFIKAKAKVVKESDGIPIWTWKLVSCGLLLAEGGAFEFSERGKQDATEEMLHYISRFGAVI
jgi:hypothetical protein